MAIYLPGERERAIYLPGEKERAIYLSGGWSVLMNLINTCHSLKYKCTSLHVLYPVSDDNSSLFAMNYDRNTLSILHLISFS